MFFYLLSLIMISRIYPLFRDDGLTVSKLIIMMIMQLFLLLFLNITLKLFLLLIILFIIDVAEFFIEIKSVRLNPVRFIFFIILFLVSLFFSLGTELSFNNELLQLIQNPFLKFNPEINLNVSGLHTIIIITGLFFLLNEANFLIRLIFEISGKIPVTKGTMEPDKKELNAGRIIGILERLIIFFFVTIGQFAAVGFVIAVKGIVRYKELEDRNFAEYVLIGTLLSSLLAILTGFAVANLLK